MQAIFSSLDLLRLHLVRVWMSFFVTTTATHSACQLNIANSRYSHRAHHSLTTNIESCRPRLRRSRINLKSARNPSHISSSTYAGIPIQSGADLSSTLDRRRHASGVVANLLSPVHVIFAISASTAALTSVSSGIGGEATTET